MLSKENKLEITEKIVTSNTFKNAPTSIALLRYLVKANIEARPLKESVIDIEFFGGDADTEKSNPRVRVNVYNLRKKLYTYYEKEGAADNWQLEIEKGQYSVHFEKKGTPQNLLTRKNALTFLPYVLFFFALVILVLSHLPPGKPELWEGFFDNEHINNLYIGDAFGYGGQTVSGLRGWTRDFTINSLDEYYYLLEQNPEMKTLTAPTDFNYSTRMAENATHSLTRFFTKWSTDFEIKYATRTSFADIKEGNTIYVGRLKDQNDFEYLFNEANTYFHVENDIVTFSGHETIADTSFATNDGTTETEFALVSRTPGPNNTEQFLFFSNHDIGVMATVEYFTNKKSLQEFSKKHLQGSPYFTAIFKAKGKERINLTLEEVLVVSLPLE